VNLLERKAVDGFAEFVISAIGKIEVLDIGMETMDIEAMVAAEVKESHVADFDGTRLAVYETISLELPTHVPAR
jgi:hypothetical protein